MTCCAHVQLPFGHLLTCCTFLNSASNPLIVSHDLLLSASGIPRPVACLRYPIACFTPHYLLPAYCVPQLPPFCVHDLLTDYCFLHDRLPTYRITQLAAYHNLQPVYYNLLIFPSWPADRPSWPATCPSWPDACLLWPAYWISWPPGQPIITSC